MPFSFGEGSLTWGEPITVQCMTMTGDLPMTLRWMFHGRELSSQMGISTLRVNPRVSLLSIDAVAGGHAGDYTCTAENAAGQSNQSASLSVNGLFISVPKLRRDRQIWKKKSFKPNQTNQNPTLSSLAPCSFSCLFYWSIVKYFSHVADWNRATYWWITIPRSSLVLL